MFQLVSLGLVAITLLIVLINVLKGLIRGLKKTLGSLAAIIAAASVSIIVTLIVCTPGSPLIETIIDALKGAIADETAQSLLSEGALADIIPYYLAMIVAPVFFIALYIVASLVFAIVAAIVIRIVFPDKKKAAKKKGAVEESTGDDAAENTAGLTKKEKKKREKVKKYRLAGAGVGLVAGLLVSAILLMPIVGVLGIAIDAGESGVLGTPEENEIAAIANEGANDSTFAIYEACCGWMFDAITSTSYEGTPTSLRNELSVLIGIATDLTALSSDSGDLSEEQIESLDSAIDTLDRSPMLTHAVSSLVADMAGSWINGETFLGMSKIEAGELIDPLIVSILEVMATTDRTNIAADMHTLTGILGILIRHDLMSDNNDTDKLLNTLGKEGVIAELIKEANKNPRMSVLSDSIAKLSVRALANTIGLPKDGDERYRKLMDEAAEILNGSYGMSYDERIDYVDRMLMDAFDEYGVDVGGDAALGISESIVDDLGSHSNLHGDDVSEFFIIYAVASETSSAEKYNGFDALASTAGTVTQNPDGTISVGGRVLKNYFANDYTNSKAFYMGKNHINIDDAASLYSAESMISSLVTLDEILSHVKNFSDCSDPDAEAELISDMLAEAMDVFGSDFEHMSKSELFANMGRILDKMHGSEVFGEDVTSGILTAVVQSETVRDELGLSTKEVTNFAEKLNSTAKGESGSYGEATQAVSTTIEVVDKINDSNTSKEDRRESTEKLISNMTPENADLLSSMTTPSMMINYGSSEASAQVVSDSVATLFSNMASFQSGSSNSTGDAVYAKEADAVNTVLILAMNSAESDEKSLFATDENGGGRTGSTAEEYVDLLVTSDVVSETLLTTVYEEGNDDNPFGVKPTEEDKVALSQAIDDYYAANSEGLSEEEHVLLVKKLNAVAIITNMEIPFAE